MGFVSDPKLDQFMSEHWNRFSHRFISCSAQQEFQGLARQDSPSLLLVVVDDVVWSLVWCGETELLINTPHHTNHQVYFPPPNPQWRDIKQSRETSRDNQVVTALSLRRYSFQGALLVVRLDIILSRSISLEIPRRLAIPIITIIRNTKYISRHPPGFTSVTTTSGP